MAGAPYGNQFALGNSGRAKKFKTPEELQKHVDLFLSAVDEGLQIPTIEGLAHWLGVTRSTLINYESKPEYVEFFAIIREAKDYIRRKMIEGAIEGRYKEGFTKFLLINNSEYRDRIEQHNTGSVDMSFKIDFGK